MTSASRTARGRKLLILAYFVLAVGLFFQWSLILSGTTNGKLINMIYFLEASTATIPGAPPVSRWTFFSLCGEVNGRNANCRKIVAALPFDLPDNFGSAQGVPSGLIGSNTNRFLSKAAWAFYIVSLFLACGTLFGSISASIRVPNSTKLQRLLALFTIFCHSCANCLMTYVAPCFVVKAITLSSPEDPLMAGRAWTVQARNAFHSSATAAKLGPMAYGFSWGSLGCYAAFLLVIGEAGDHLKAGAALAVPVDGSEEENGLVRKPEKGPRVANF